jgi:hypothetical protein
MELSKPGEGQPPVDAERAFRGSGALSAVLTAPVALRVLSAVLNTGPLRSSVRGSDIPKPLKLPPTLNINFGILFILATSSLFVYAIL